MNAVLLDKQNKVTATLLTSIAAETMEQKRKEVSKDDNNNNHDSNNNSDNTPNRNIFLRDVTVGAKVAEGNFGKCVALSSHLSILTHSLLLLNLST